MQAKIYKQFIFILLIFLITSFALAGCEKKEKESVGEKIVQDVVKSVVQIKKEYDNNKNNKTDTAEPEKTVIVEEPKDSVSKIMLQRLEKMYDLIDDPLSGNYMKEHFPDLELIYSNENKTMQYFYSELVNSTFKLWSRHNKVISIKEGKRIDFD
ncbi:hypothetical protein KY325_05260 [Candidatus Woesearchaeota archaeon]|nr:hypothetical protein [Candidatus Woesearchaeota archaeon]MBW3018543.1 hypothetical protein [Candidatus Woesearchaeota archaeon]